MSTVSSKRVGSVACRWHRVVAMFRQNVVRLADTLELCGGLFVTRILVGMRAQSELIEEIFKNSFDASRQFAAPVCICF